MIARCAEMKGAFLEEDWDGRYLMKSK